MFENEVLVFFGFLLFVGCVRFFFWLVVIVDLIVVIIVVYFVFVIVFVCG